MIRLFIALVLGAIGALFLRIASLFDAKLIDGALTKWGKDDTEKENFSSLTGDNTK